MEMRRNHGMPRAWVAAVGAAAALATAFALSAAPMASAQPVAHASGGCNISRGNVWHKLGPSYVEALNVTQTSCGTGENVVKAYNKCRLEAGGTKGYCHSKVLGFSCSEKRPGKSPVQFVARVQCTAGRKAVSFTYSENT
jgi:hypothetical protein